jgi:hypothetical protein
VSEKHHRGKKGDEYAMQYNKYKKAPSSGLLLDEAINAGLSAFEKAIYRLVCKVIKPKRKRK